jgi:molybdopterin-containing oxidoreductase family iron-sulfur binding subunit
MSADKSLDLASIRARLDGARGRRFWQSLEELADTEEFRGFVQREFPQHASEWFDPVGRRNFLKLMGASLALAGATACTRQPDELLVPYVRQPENLVPGRPLFFATAMPLAGSAIGLLAESHEGRPTKIEGNPDHPASLGATDAFAQASVQQLYDPDRATAITYLGEIRPWGSFVTAIQNAIGTEQALQGAGLRFLSEPVASPTLASQVQEILAAFPQAKWHTYDAVNREQVYAGASLAFGSAVETSYRFDQARVAVVLDDDVFGGGPGALRYARDFANGRRVRKASAEMNRLYVAEPSPTPTGALADHRLPVRASRIEAIARAIAAGVGAQGAGGSTGDAALDKWVAAVVKDLQAARGAGIVLAGASQPAPVHAVVHAINQALGNAGTTVVYTDPVQVETGSQTASLGELVAAMNAGQVRVLLVLGGNPVYNAPADLDFAGALKKVVLRIRLGLYDDETSASCHWQVPETHYLEQWSDVRTFDGTVSIVQPLVQPLYHGRSVHEVLALFTKRPERTPYETVRDFWRAQPQAAGQDFEKFWRKSVHDGLVAGTALPSKAVSVSLGQSHSSGQSQPAGGLEIRFAADPTVHDGRFANIGWLQELPKPISKLTWDNAAIVAPSTAARLGLANEDVVEITYRDRKVNAPVWVQPGHAPDSVTVHLGYGRTRAGRAAEGAGFNAYALRTSDAPWFGAGAALRKTGDTYRLAVTQGHHTMEGRAIVRSGTIEDFRHDPAFARHLVHDPPKTLTMYPDYKYEGYSWGMAIDQSVCSGCSACVVACVAENNIPVIGKDQVLRGRELAWLRIDRYFEGDPDNPSIHHQPMLCQHCENAPCEVVCPVAATTHSPEGLNEMTYNRCVGTRYCSHNCPYKVRRFNFLLYSDYTTPSVKLVKNPDVSVRSRGVMEKCTFCVQRINRARQDAKVQDRTIRDGEVKTACQAACPTDAIVFGNINDPQSRVSQLKAEAHNYAVLGDLNTRPRTTYLAAIKNPSADIGPVRLHEGHGEHGDTGLPSAPPATESERNSERH